MHLKNSNAMAMKIFLEDWLAFIVEHRNVPGISLSVTHGMESIVSTGAGVSDMQSGKALSSSTNMDVASQTKFLVLISLLQLRQNGCLQLSDSIDRYFPELSSFDRELPSIYELLTHQSGWIRDSITGPADIDFAAEIKEQAHRASSSRTPRYSNFGYLALAEIIQRITGMRFEEYADEHIIRPLGMLDSRWFHQMQKDEVCQCYGPEIGGKRSPTIVDAPDAIGATGLWSSTNDLCRLATTFLGLQPSILRPDDALLCTTIHWNNSPSTATGRSFGLGLETRVMNGKRWFGHTGGAIGFVSDTFFNRDLSVAFSIGLNCRDIAALGSLTECIATSIDLFLPENQSSENNKDGFQHSLSGRYRNETGFLQILCSPKGIWLIDPLAWNPFAGALRLTLCNTGALTIADTNFEYGGTQVRSVHSSDVIQFGNQRYQRVQ